MTPSQLVETSPLSPRRLLFDNILTRKIRLTYKLLKRFQRCPRSDWWEITTYLGAITPEVPQRMVQTKLKR